MSSNNFQRSQPTNVLPPLHNTLSRTNQPQPTPDHYLSALSPSIDKYRALQLLNPQLEPQESFSGYPDLPPPPTFHPHVNSSHATSSTTISRHSRREHLRPYPAAPQPIEWPELPPPPPSLSLSSRQGPHTSLNETLYHYRLGHLPSDASRSQGMDLCISAKPPSQLPDGTSLSPQGHYGFLSSTPTSSSTPLFGVSQAPPRDTQTSTTGQPEPSSSTGPSQRSARQGQKKISCPGCDKTFGRPYDLKRHRESSCPQNENKRTFPCPNHVNGCETKFARKDGFQKHIDGGHCRANQSSMANPPNG